jgi:hypothetical protein
MFRSYLAPSRLIDYIAYQYDGWCAVNSGNRVRGTSSSGTYSRGMTVDKGLFLWKGDLPLRLTCDPVKTSDHE